MLAADPSCPAPHPGPHHRSVGSPSNEHPHPHPRPLTRPHSRRQCAPAPLLHCTHIQPHRNRTPLQRRNQPINFVPTLSLPSALPGGSSPPRRPESGIHPTCAHLLCSCLRQLPLASSSAPARRAELSYPLVFRLGHTT
uniref:Uncharacterized protein n=1 Tax=Physcomitrium patens TaxID=3218 RepID=A0A2K1IAV8_PHYPA|nr:hypothetical protein PHYPA_030973 [Physcomitrium patens]